MLGSLEVRAGSGEVLEVGGAAAATLADRILAACPQIRILATSREPLSITGEAPWTVGPLTLPPDPAVSGMGSADSSASVRLLSQRARAVVPGFEITAANAAVVARICRALDGMPLAIELAAARLRTMAPEQVAARLDDRFGLLTGGSRVAMPRHQTQRAMSTRFSCPVSVSSTDAYCPVSPVSCRTWCACRTTS